MTQESRRTRSAPTHILTVEVPLRLDGQPDRYDVVRDAMRAVLAVSAAAYDEHICGDTEVRIAVVDDA
jgi:hypothetical protein